MDAAQLAMWRDAALILLALQAMVLCLPVAAGLYWSVRGIQRLRQWIRPVLFQTRLHVWKIQFQTGRVTRGVAAPFVWLQSTVAGLQRALHMLGWR